MDDKQREEEIRRIAYGLWEGEGRPHGRHLDHWARAEALWRQQQQAASRAPATQEKGSAAQAGRGVWKKRR